MRKFFLACILFVTATGIHAQQDTWDLRRCVEYAIANSISVKQADVQARIAALTTKLSKARAYPNLSFNTQAGFNFGRSIDPTSNQYTTNSVFFQSLGANSGVTLFNFFSVKNGVAAAQLNEEAVKNSLNAARNDISLTVANYYLSYLLSLEQTNAANVQIAQTTSQLGNTRKLVDAGSMPELNAAQLEAQLANDSSTYITQKGLAEQAKINLMASLNLDLATPFEVSVPDVNKIPLEPLADLQPDAVYQLALNTQPLQKFDSLIVKSAEYSIKSARGAMYPSLSAFAQIGSNYASTYREFAGATPTGKFDTTGVVPVNGINYYSLTPGYNTLFTKPSYFRQVGNINFTQAFGISLNVPIAGNRQLRHNYDQARLNLETFRLSRQQHNVTLQSNIYLAYTSSVSALQKYNASTKAVETSQYAFDLAKKRYEIGVMQTIDYITTQSNLFKAKSDQLYAKYDYVFKMKILEFYKGQGVKL